MTDELRDIDRQVAEAITAQGGGNWAWVGRCERCSGTGTVYRNYYKTKDSKWEPITCEKCEGLGRIPLPFSSDPCAAWMLLEWLWRNKYKVSFWGEQSVIIYTHALTQEHREINHNIYLALCRAFLKAVGGEK